VSRKNIAMKASINILESIDKEELDKLSKEIKETLAFKYTDKKRVFSSVDLWNIQRRRKSISVRRNYV
jgi:hypothetical protein